MNQGLIRIIVEGSRETSHPGSHNDQRVVVAVPAHLNQPGKEFLSYRGMCVVQQHDAVERPLIRMATVLEVIPKIGQECPPKQPVDLPPAISIEIMRRSIEID